MEKILSVIIPTYNMEKYLDKCLTSLIVEGPVFTQLEVLVIIDGAKDRSSEIAHGYESRYPEVFRVIDKENGNYGSCINRGLKEARGKYIKILDADDYYDTVVLKRYLPILTSNDADVFITNDNEVNEAGDILNHKSFDLPKNKVLPVDASVYDLIKEKLQMHSVTYRRQILLDIAYVQTEGVSYTDQQWVFLPMAAVKSYMYVDEYLYKYLVGREGQTVLPEVIAKSFNSSYTVFKQMLTDYLSYPESNARGKRYLKDRILLSAFYMYERGIYNGYYKKDDILIFDRFMKKESPSIYDECGQFSVSNTLSLRFVSLWRNGFGWVVTVMHKCLDVVYQIRH